jgi:hypothetical protein
VGHEHAQIKPISLDVVLNLAGPVKKRLRGKNRTGAMGSKTGFFQRKQTLIVQKLRIFADLKKI